MITAYSDGSISKNPGGEVRATWYLNGKHYEHIPENLPVEKRTNNYAELLGMICLLEVIKNLKTAGEKITVNTDSQVVRSWVRMERKYANKKKLAHLKNEIIKMRDLLDEICSCNTLEVVWIPEYENIAHKYYPVPRQVPVL